MLYPFSEEQKILRDTIRSFIRKSVDPAKVMAFDHDRKPLLDEYRAIAKNGWLCIGGAPQFGGVGNFVDVVILLEEVSKGSHALSCVVGRTVSYACPTIDQWGSPRLKEKYIPGLMAGNVILSVAMTEPSTGSDAAGITTRAEKSAGGFRINGEKIYSSGAEFADIFLVSTRTGAPSEKGGVTTFIVDRHSPGITITPIDALGHHSNAFGAVHFDNVLVPEENILGPFNGGWSVLNAHLERERINIAAKALGGMDASLKEATDFANARIQFGKPIATFQAIRHKLADMATDLHLSRLITYDAAAKYASGKKCRFEAFSAKVFATEAYIRVANHGLQIMGAHGYTARGHAERHVRDSRAGPIGGGTSEIMRNSIGKMVAEDTWFQE